MKNEKNTMFEYTSEDVRSGKVEISSGQPEKQRKINPWLYMFLVVIASVGLAVLFITSAIDRVNEGLVMELQVGEITPWVLDDGQYSGTYSSNDLGAAVTVTIQSGYITNITLDGFKGIDTARAQLVFDAIIRAQSLDTYDGDAGTEPTDIILMLAVENAIENGIKDAASAEVIV